MTSPVAGTRVLIVEDEALVAMLLEDVLEELGCEVIGPIGRVDAARAAIEEGRFDCALLDINLRGQTVYPLVELLDRRAVPFGFVTGYGPGGVEPQFKERPVLQKPFTAKELEKILAGMTKHGRRSSKRKH